MTSGAPTLPALPTNNWQIRSNAVLAARYFAAALEHQDPGVLDRLRNDAEVAVEARTDVELVLVDDNDRAVIASGCSTAGLYYANAKPPQLIIAMSASHGRNGFTILHELAHHLQRTDPAWLIPVLATLPSAAAQRLEHQVCDEFASEILLPTDMIKNLLGDQSPTAGVLRDLRASHPTASRAAFLVRASQNLPIGSALILLDRAGEVVFNHARGDDLAPPPRGTVLNQPLIQRAREAGAAESSGSIDFTYATGKTRADLTATAATDNWGYTYIVAQQDHAYGQQAQWSTNTLDCSCGAEYVRADATGNCPHCQQPLCPECTTCTCRDSQVTLCSRCSMTLSVVERNRGLTEHEDCA